MTSLRTGTIVALLACARVVAVRRQGAVTP